MISVVVCSRDGGRFERVNAEFERALVGQDWEMIRIADATGMAEGYNRGVRLARGEILIFSHDDVEILTDELGKRVRGHLGKVDLIGPVGTSLMRHPMWHGMGPPYLYGQIAHVHENGFEVAIYSTPTRLVENIEALDGVFLACRREVAEKVGFDERFEGFHLYDLDFSYSAKKSGYRVGVACDIPIVHHSRGSYDAEWVAAAAKFMEKFPEVSAKEKGKFFVGGVVVKSKDEVVERTIPPHWVLNH
jgi:hypothetical protein